MAEKYKTDATGLSQVQTPTAEGSAQSEAALTAVSVKTNGRFCLMRREVSKARADIMVLELGSHS